MDIYGLGLLRKEREPYCIPMPLKEIDELTIRHTKEELFEMLRQNDSILEEENPNQLRIFKKIGNRWKEAKISYLDEETKYILSFSIENLFQKERKTKILNILHSYFINGHFKNLSSAMKNTILSMKLGKESFLESLSFLSYEEMRLIRTYLAKNFDVKKLGEFVPEKIVDFPGKIVSEITNTKDLSLEKKKAS